MLYLKPLYLEYRPGAPLDSFIESFWYTRGYRPEHARERVLPNGTMALIISLARETISDCSREPGDLRVDALAPALIAGVHTGYMVIDTADLAEMIGVQFRAGGNVPFFGVPADLSRDRHLDLESLWGREARVLRERLREACSAKGKFAILEAALLARARGRMEWNPCVAFAVREFQTPAYGGSVAAVTERIGLSPRRFAQVFREQVGVTPKLYCRILRFQQAMRRMSRGGEVDWPELALSCGYFDQSHFVNDFREFSGINPTSYSSHRLQWMNHVAIEG
jgi:AraC-like DNA-binding protein